MLRTFVAVPIVAALIVAGCTTVPAGEEAGERSACFRARDVHDFDAIDDHHVVVEARRADYYLLTLEGACSGLLFARGITIADAMSRVCGDGSAWLAFEHAGTGVKRCRIVAVERVDDPETAKARLLESSRNTGENE